MQCTISKTNDLVRIDLCGRMDATTASSFVTTCQEQIDEGGVKLLVDLAGVEYMSSAGLRGILTVLKVSKAKNVSIGFCAPQPMVSEVFKISGFNTMMPIFSSAEDAQGKL